MTTTTIIFVQCASHPTVRTANSPVAGRPVGDWSGYLKAKETGS